MGIQTYLTSQRVSFESLIHAPAATASVRARLLHTPGRSVAKGVLVRAGDGFVLAVLPATGRIDLTRLSNVLGGQPVSLATEDDLEDVFGDCQRGALPPLGSLYGLRTLLDSSLAAGPEIVFVGNQRHEGIKMSFLDYEALESPTQAQFMSLPDQVDATNQRRAG